MATEQVVPRQNFLRAHFIECAGSFAGGFRLGTEVFSGGGQQSNLR
jgi:hypothetical protein